MDDWSLKVADVIDEEVMYRDMSRLTAAVEIYRSRWADLGYRDETSTLLALQSTLLVRLAHIFGALPENGFGKERDAERRRCRKAVRKAVEKEIERLWAVPHEPRNSPRDCCCSPCRIWRDLPRELRDGGEEE